MKIGIVLAQPPSYSETFFNSKIKGLSEYGYTVELYVRDNSSGYKNCKVYSAPKVSKTKVIQLFKTAFVLLGLLFSLKRVLTFIKLEKSAGRSKAQVFKNVYTNSHLLKADINWLHFGFTTLAIESEHVAKSIGAKMAVSCRGYDMDVYPLKNPNCYNLVWKNVDKVHTISKYMLAKAKANGMLDATKTTIITPAIKTSLFENDIEKQIDKTKLIHITTIARLHWIKGLDYTLRALTLLKSKDIKFKYQIIGTGTEYESLRFAVHELGLENSVSFVGKLSHQETLNRLESTDLYIQYSQSEGFCNAVLEAQAMNCLCVVSDGGALPENVLDNETGWVVPKRNPKALTETIFRVLNMDALALKAIRTKARKRVLNDFAIKRQIQSFIDFYE
ncbi:glycosyltransferase family 4 protein [uncultured Winogradskyella sp.]|uniref:glycosyltransferase family 4 protein n=1 Tax=uncultured Winogradskyella sp. TaxID=395353 RepID=UPI0026232D42|nr:glycosyltransferase family 4 protein [uncultured Winogradskyella sp.]